MSLLKYLILYLITIVKAQKLTDMFCGLDWIHERKHCFNKDVLVTMTHSSNQIVVDRSNNVYFSFDSGQGEYIPVKVKIGNNTLSVLKGIKDAFAMTYDNAQEDIYFGGSYGIYKYDTRHKKLKRLAIPHLDIWWLTVKTQVYFIKFPSLNAYCYRDRIVELVEPLKNHNVQQFVFDYKDHIIFINLTGLYAVVEPNKSAITIRDETRFLGMAIDRHDMVFVCSEDGIFSLDSSFKLRRHLDIKGVLAMAFDNSNNLIYSDSHEIVRLVPIPADTDEGTDKHKDKEINKKGNDKSKDKVINT